jgi:hypothetical protein
MNGQIEKRLEQLERQIEQKRNQELTGVVIVSSEKEVPPYFKGTVIIDDI